MYICKWTDKDAYLLLLFPGMRVLLLHLVFCYCIFIVGYDLYFLIFAVFFVLRECSCSILQNIHTKNGKQLFDCERLLTNLLGLTNLGNKYEDYSKRLLPCSGTH